MATRIGIELSPTACRIVEIDAGLSWRKNAHETRVVSFTVLPPSGPETQAKLESLRGHRAAVVVWDGSSDHRQVMVTRGSYETMRAEALGALEAAGVTTRGVWADIAPVTEPGDRGTRRPVVVALSSAAALRSALEPLQNAGIRVRSVMTPAVALDSLARQRRALTVPGSIEAYVALEETLTTLALVQDGALLAARDLAWGYLDENVDGQQPRPERPLQRAWRMSSRNSWRTLRDPPGHVRRRASGLRVRRAQRTAQHDGAADGASRRRGGDARLAVRDRRRAASRGGRRISGARRRAAARVGCGRGLAAGHQPASRAQAPGFESDPHADGDRGWGARCWASAWGFAVARMDDGHEGAGASRLESAGPSRAGDAIGHTGGSAGGANANKADRCDGKPPVLAASPQPAAMKSSVPAAKPSVVAKLPVATAPPQAVATTVAGGDRRTDRFNQRGRGDFALVMDGEAVGPGSQAGRRDETAGGERAAEGRK